MPSLFMAYIITVCLITLGIIELEREMTDETCKIIKDSFNLKYISSQYLLPAALVL